MRIRGEFEFERIRANSNLHPYQGEGGPSSLPRGGGGRRSRGLRAGGGVGGGGVAPRPPCSPSEGLPAVPYPAPPLVVGAFPPGVRVRSGRGGRRGGPWTAPPMAPSDPNPPSVLQEWATLRVARCTGLGFLPRAAPGRGPCAAPARRCGLAYRPRPPREQAAWGVGARGVLVQLRPPPSREGGRLFGSGGAGGRRSRGPQAGGERGGGGGCSAAPRPPAPPGVGLPSIPPGYTRARICSKVNDARAGALSQNEIKR